MRFSLDYIYFIGTLQAYHKAYKASLLSELEMANLYNNKFILHKKSNILCNEHLRLKKKLYFCTRKY